jgi:hypothetical protein
MRDDGTLATDTVAGYSEDSDGKQDDYPHAMPTKDVAPYDPCLARQVGPGVPDDTVEQFANPICYFYRYLLKSPERLLL